MGQLTRFVAGAVACNNTCKSCNSSHATTSGQPCSEGSTADTVICACNAGYYGNGVECTPLCRGGFFADGNMCRPCRTCDIYATQLDYCLTGSASDIQCSCNSGYYGNGTLCNICQTCDVHATTPGTCPAGTISNFHCYCSAGFFGNGVTCSVCPAGTYVSHAGILLLRGLHIYSIAL